METKKHKISDTTAFLMVFTALCFDGIQALVGWVPLIGNTLAMGLSIIIFLTFFLWLKLYKVNMMTPKRFFSMVGANVVELIPFLNILPAWTLVIVYLIGTTRINELIDKHPRVTGGMLNTAQKLKGLNINQKQPRVPFIDE